MAIQLAKGQKIDLTKTSGATLTKFCVGVNWGAIETIKSGIFRDKVIKNEVDLDLSCIMFFSDGQRWDHLYSPLYNPEALQKIGLPPGKLVSVDGALRHSGDDLTGDMDGDDGLDNEIISVDLTRVAPEINQIFFFVNNAGNEDFSEIPFAKIRMYEGTPERVDQVHAEFDVVQDSAYQGRSSMIMGKLYKRGENWKFGAIGDATEDPNFAATIVNIMKNYV
ncbi:MAG: TerD family protein [Luteolibacter sp.]